MPPSRFITPKSCPPFHCWEHLFMTKMLHKLQYSVFMTLNPPEIQGLIHCYDSGHMIPNISPKLSAKLTFRASQHLYKQSKIKSYQIISAPGYKQICLPNVEHQNKESKLPDLQAGRPRSEVHVDLLRHRTGQASHAGSFIEVRVGSCCSYCGNLAHEVTLRALLCILGSWFHTLTTVGTVYSLFVAGMSQGMDGFV